MPIIIDAERGKRAAELLFRSFSTTGIHGRTEMPEDIAPEGVVKGSLEHTLFITLLVAIDYQRDADALWESSRRTFDDPETRYLFDPQALHENPPKKIVQDMQRYKLSKKQKKDAHIWRTVWVTFYKKWRGDPRNFLANCQWNAPLIPARLKMDSHLDKGKRIHDYPYLRGDKIGPLWVRMLRDNVGLSEIRNLHQVPIPVDVHVARSTISIGVVRGSFRGSLDNLFEFIRQVWFRSTEGLRVIDRDLIALDVDEPLWHLSKYRCTDRDKLSGICPHIKRCEAKEFCIPGKIEVGTSRAEVKT